MYTLDPLKLLLEKFQNGPLSNEEWLDLLFRISWRLLEIPWGIKEDWLKNNKAISEQTIKCYQNLTILLFNPSDQETLLSHRNSINLEIIIFLKKITLNSVPETVGSKDLEQLVIKRNQELIIQSLVSHLQEFSNLESVSSIELLAAIRILNLLGENIKYWFDTKNESLKTLAKLRDLFTHLQLHKLCVFSKDQEFQIMVKEFVTELLPFVNGSLIENSNDQIGTGIDSFKSRLEDYIKKHPVIASWSKSNDEIRIQVLEKMLSEKQKRIWIVLQNNQLVSDKKLQEIISIAELPISIDAIKNKGKPKKTDPEDASVILKKIHDEMTRENKLREVFRLFLKLSQYLPEEGIDTESQIKTYNRIIECKVTRDLISQFKELTSISSDLNLIQITELMASFMDLLIDAEGRGSQSTEFNFALFAVEQLIVSFHELIKAPKKNEPAVLNESELKEVFDFFSKDTPESFQENIRVVRNKLGHDVQDDHNSEVLWVLWDLILSRIATLTDKPDSISVLASSINKLSLTDDSIFLENGENNVIRNADSLLSLEEILFKNRDDIYNIFNQHGIIYNEVFLIGKLGAEGDREIGIWLEVDFLITFRESESSVLQMHSKRKIEPELSKKLNLKVKLHTESDLRNLIGSQITQEHYDKILNGRVHYIKFLREADIQDLKSNGALFLPPYSGNDKEELSAITSYVLSEKQLNQLDIQCVQDNLDATLPILEKLAGQYYSKFLEPLFLYLNNAPDKRSSRAEFLALLIELNKLEKEINQVRDSIFDFLYEPVSVAHFRYYVLKNEFKRPEFSLTYSLRARENFSINMNPSISYPEKVEERRTALIKIDQRKKALELEINEKKSTLEHSVVKILENIIHLPELSKILALSSLEDWKKEIFLQFKKIYSTNSNILLFSTEVGSTTITQLVNHEIENSERDLFKQKVNLIISKIHELDTVIPIDVLPAFLMETENYWFSLTGMQSLSPDTVRKKSLIDNFVKKFTKEVSYAARATLTYNELEQRMSHFRDRCKEIINLSKTVKDQKLSNSLKRRREPYLESLEVLINEMRDFFYQVDFLKLLKARIKNDPLAYIEYFSENIKRANAKTLEDCQMIEDYCLNLIRESNINRHLDQMIEEVRNHLSPTKDSEILDILCRELEQLKILPETQKEEDSDGMQPSKCLRKSTEGNSRSPDSFFHAAQPAEQLHESSQGACVDREMHDSTDTPNPS